MIKHIFFPSLISILLLAPSLSSAQSDTLEIKAVIDQLFKGMKVKDTSMIRAAFIKDPFLSTSFIRKGESHFEKDDLRDFLSSIASAKTDTFDLNEVIESYEIRIDGPMAAVWTPYSFYMGKQFSHCGVNNFQLFKAREGWKITGIMDTRRREPCKK